ncbi:MAG: hypothetical protein JO035_03910, partial [Betaproteobacteria bacterium]|nr:hypothetical protein [Betaproteobacteria bacterium]
MQRPKGKGSVRVNLSVPAEIDAVLAGLAERTAASKASFVMQALQQYLPVLRRTLAEHDEVKAYVDRKYREITK